MTASPHAAAGPHAPAGETRVRIPAQAGRIGIGAALCLALGIPAVLSPWLPDDIVPEAPMPVLVSGWIFSALGVLLAVGLFAAMRPRWFSMSAQGLAYVDPRMPREEWRFAWPELVSVAVHVGQVRVRRRGLAAVARPPQRVRLVLMPMSAAAVEPYPALRVMYGAEEAGTTAVVLGDVPRLVPELDAALRQWAGSRYRGIVDDGDVTSRL